MTIASVRASQKREKDLMPANLLYQILTDREPDRLEDRLDDAARAARNGAMRSMQASGKLNGS